MSARNFILSIAVVSILVSQVYTAQACDGRSDVDGFDELVKAQELTVAVNGENNAGGVIVKKNVISMDEHEQKVFELLNSIVMNQNDITLARLIIEYVREASATKGRDIHSWQMYGKYGWEVPLD